jgi:hypothetical protein
LDVVAFHTQSQYDKLEEPGAASYGVHRRRRMSGTDTKDLQQRHFTSEITFTWSSDSRIQKPGWQICVKASLLETNATVSVKGGAPCTIPQQDINADEKPCGNKTVLEDGETCTPVCSEGMAAKDAEFECKNGELHEGDAIADPEDLKCKAVSASTR